MTAMTQNVAVVGAGIAGMQCALDLAESGYYVYLVENPNTLNANELGATLDLGLLQSLTGDQMYAIPSGTDISPFQGVIIFCLEFDFVFSTAPFVE